MLSPLGLGFTLVVCKGCRLGTLGFRIQEGATRGVLRGAGIFGLGMLGRAPSLGFIYSDHPWVRYL